ncbi:response regulator [Psychrosphaera algicola]|uniref:Response regulator n=1 Tax=Psychrosphaera algicola TaxID=3023714 RepID=A0ABT5F9R0_9GAMM|nr:response regulator [Psychrosphaera sp. G1-22]MDC2888270.1 response regulator [Psychrosphaera sp. G1-22]
MDLTHSLQAALVIEHQALAQSHIKYSLLNLGFKSIEFADRATMAIKALHKSHFDLILCAYDLNRGADGYQLFERIIEEGLLKSTTAFVFMSSENDLPLSQSIIELKPDDFILKPFTAKELELRLKRILSKKLTLRPVFEAIDDDEFDGALNLLNEQLAKNAKPKWVPYLLKLKGN